MVRTDEEILQIAAEHNVGDLALGNKPNQRRATLLNRQGLRANVFPGEVVNRNKPNANFQFAWVPYKDSEFFQDLKDDGYMPVVERDWVCGRDGWEWYTPEKEVFRWSVSGMLTNRDEFLMYRDEDAYKREMDRRLGFNDEQTRARNEQFAENTVKSARDGGVGIEVDVTAKGKTISNTSVRRTIVS